MKLYKVIALLIFYSFFSARIFAAGNIINIQQSLEGMLLKTLDLRIDFRVINNISVGAIYKYHGWRTTSSTKCPHMAAGKGGYSLGIRASFLFNKEHILETSNWFISPYVIMHKYRLMDSYDIVAYTDAVCTDYYETGLIAGYQWFWASGFNIKLGAGIRHDSEPVLFKKNTRESIQTRPTLELTLGFAF
jgi:hypothetical protein